MNHRLYSRQDGLQRRYHIIFMFDIYATTTGSKGKIQPSKKITDLSSLSDFEFVGDWISPAVPREGMTSSIAFFIWTDRRDKTDIFDFEDEIVVDRFTLGR